MSMLYTERPAHRLVGHIANETGKKQFGSQIVRFGFRQHNITVHKLDTHKH